MFEHYLDGDSYGQMGGQEELKFMFGALELYPALEDEAGCSGMCETGLFYFGKSIKHVPPHLTCMRHFKYYLDRPAKMMGRTAVFASVLALLLSFLHCCLIDRDEIEHH